jgi:tetratricopeptide (TPR) repeat protein
MERKKQVAELNNTNVISLRMDATFFFERAVQSLDRFHYDKALKYFRRALEYEPDNPVNHCNMAGILSEIGNFEESNNILEHILNDIDPSMTECYFYMANNYANMDQFEEAEKALVRYLESDPEGQYLDESHEMMELISFELERPTNLKNIKSRENFFEHDKARLLLEEGKFAEALRVLEKVVKKYPDFFAARNNLALAYYYMGQFDKAMNTIEQVLDIDPGNLHALCNLAIFCQHEGKKETLSAIIEVLRKTYPFHQEHVFKLATTMGILGEHEAAYRHFKRLMKMGASFEDPCLYHYTAVAACNTGRYDEAHSLWKQAEKLDPGSDIPKFYLSQHKKITSGEEHTPIYYHYHLPFEEQFHMLTHYKDGLPDQLKRDPLVRSSFFWALRHGDHDTKLQVIQALGMIGDQETEIALRDFLQEPKEDDYLKKVAIFVLRSMGINEPIQAFIDGEQKMIQGSPLNVNLPVWEEKWQAVMELSIKNMSRRYDMVQQYDLQTLWVEFLTRSYPQVPSIYKVEGWAAALEYLTAKMHRRTISYDEVSRRYDVSVSTIRKNVKLIDDMCGLREKMKAIFPQYGGKF